MHKEPFKAPCREACPAGVDVPRYLRFIVAGQYAEALAVIRESIPFPSVCGYVCPAPCELKCQLGQLNLGPEAQNCAVYTMKGHAPRGHGHRAMWREMFDTATADIGTYESGYMGPADPDTHSLKDRFSPEDVSTHVAKTKGRRQFDDTLGSCIFCTRAPLRFVVEAFNLVTGWDFSVNEAHDVGFRVANLVRAFNIRHGVSVDLDQPSPRWSSAPTDGPAKGKSIVSHWDDMLDNYHRLMGWDRQTGKPLPETLRALGLESVVDDLWA